jgi:hypothetical protein
MSAELRPGLQFNPQTVVGLLIVLAGVLLTADNLGILEAGRILRFWPAGVLAVGIMMWLRANDTPARTWAGFVVALGGLWTIARLLDWPVNFSMVFPLAIVMIGVVIVQRAIGLHREEQPGAAQQSMSEIAFWSGVDKRVRTQLFRRADLTAVMGGIQLDFRDSQISGEAVIDMFVLMGGVELRLPPDWTVSNQVMAVMGGVQEKSTGATDGKHRLILRGYVMMGGVEVKT